MDAERFARVLADARVGRHDAFAELFRELHAPLVRYLKVAATRDAEDLASETWLQVARDIRRFRGDAGAFRAWVFAIARHRAIDHARSRAGKRPDVPAGMTPPDSPGGPDPAEIAQQTASTQEALALIATLPRDQAEVLVLRVVAGFDVADVARIMGKRPGTVRVLAHRGLRTLEEKLGSL